MRNDDLGIEADRQDAIAKSGILKRSLDPELASLVAFTAAKYNATFAALSIIYGRRQILLASIGSQIVEMPAEASFCQTTIQRPGEPLIVPDATVDRRFANLSVVRQEPRLRFYAGYAVTDRNGFALGALCIGDQKPRLAPFDSTDLMIRAHEVERLLRW